MMGDRVGATDGKSRKALGASKVTEFDSAFTRLDHIDECITDVQFDVMWHRHTGQWYRLFSSVGLDEALRLIETEGLLQQKII